MTTLNRETASRYKSPIWEEETREKKNRNLKDNVSCMLIESVNKQNTIFSMKQKS